MPISVKKNEVISWTYVTELIERMAEFFTKKYEFWISFERINSLGILIERSKNRIEKYKKSGVYKLVCKDCPKIYIGQTWKTFKKRIEEYMRCFINNNLGSAYSDIRYSDI